MIGGMRHKDLIDLLGRLKGSGAWQQIADEADVDYMTLSRIYRGEIESPGILTCERIADAAVKHDKRIKREARRVNG